MMQKKPISFNINNWVRVKLTDAGRVIHRQAHEEQMKLLSRPDDKYTPPKEDVDGWSLWQLWRLMQLFGPHMTTGFNHPFETTIELFLNK